MLTFAIVAVVLITSFHLANSPSSSPIFFDDGQLSAPMIMVPQQASIPTIQAACRSYFLTQLPDDNVEHQEPFVAGCVSGVQVQLK
jgi:hypothetical protein